MSDAISILIVTGTFLVLLWASLLLARFLLSAILLLMKQGGHRALEMAIAPTSTKRLVKRGLSIGKSQGDSLSR